MSDEDVRVAEGEATAAEEADSDFMILRTLRMVKPGQMAMFMNTLNWQSLWLSQAFGWFRLVVGYALTDIPERVLEIYGVPLPRKEQPRAQEMLARLYAQPGYAMLKDCLREDREQVEELLPAMGFDTRIKQLMAEVRREKQLVERREGTARELERLQGEIATLTAREGGLAEKIRSADATILGLEMKLAELQNRKSRDIAQDIIRLELEIKAEKKKRQAFQKELDAAKATRATLESRQSQTRQDLARVERELQEAMDPAKREKKFEIIKTPAYFLSVNIPVRPGLMESFDKGMDELAHDFKWDFLAAGRPPPKVGEGGRMSEEVVNLWGLKDANDLYRQMVELRENERFAALDELTGDETQMLLADWEVLSGVEKPLPPFAGLPLHA